MITNYTITDTLLYQEYDNDKEFYEALEDYINSGFPIKETIYLCPLVSNGKNDIILSRFKIKDPDINIKKKIERLYKKQRLMKPDYKDTILNIIAGIRKNYGYPSRYEEPKEIFDKKYKNCIILLIDGMGMNILNENLEGDDFLRKNILFSEHAIYPSTTAASTTATVSGRAPQESGWTGWENYIKELDRDIILFTGENYFTGEKTGRTGYDFMPVIPFYSDMRVRGYQINPDFSKPQVDINDVLNQSLEKLNNPKGVIEYVYWPEPDTIMHKTGPYSIETKTMLKEINDKVERYANTLPEDTLLIISADHGHTPVEPIDFYHCKSIYKYLKNNPSNDSRCITFRVKDGCHKEFEKTFNQLFGNIYKLMKSEDAIKEGYFGPANTPIHSRISDFLGDYVAMATNKYYFNYKGPDGHIFKSHHAGITKDEMEVPVIVIRK